MNLSPSADEDPSVVLDQHEPEPRQPEAERTEYSLETQSTILQGAVVLMTYMAVNKRKAFLVQNLFADAVIAVSQTLDISRDDALSVIARFARDEISELLDDPKRRREFVRDLEARSTNIDFSAVEEEEFYDFSAGIPAKFDESLDDWKGFSEWSELFRSLSPRDVSALGSEALGDKPRVASVQTHFWNAIIDHMITAAFLAPELDDNLRVATIEMASKYQAVVRAMLKDKPDDLRMCEDAWELTAKQGNDLKGSRDMLFDIGSINRWGQNLPT
ncbi:MAG: hypothetical protein EOS58_25500 [Mesorhizobium sp.]|nr:MAG: hypothetical protein EOS58_25500 [Mesorhizobium sp.]